MQVLLFILFVLVVGGLFYLRHDRFGASATGERLLRMQNTPTFKNGVFHNIEHTPDLAEDKGYGDVFKTFLFGKDPRNVPDHVLPTVRTDLHAIPLNQNAYVWFGHSSYYLQLDGKRILVDPVFSKYATPVRISIRAFDGTNVIVPEDLPEIDVLVITHDHWDHLDYNTFKKIQHKVKQVVTGLGVGAHLEKWGYPAAQITELYWGDSTQIAGFTFTSATARHFSGRLFKRNVTLWSSFILSGSKILYLGGDSGYGSHFKQIGEEHGPFDFAILENGQYNDLWKYIHMMPEEVILAAQDLRAAHTIPVHSAKFPLANHAWDEPLNRVYQAGLMAGANLVLPKIGQLVSLDAPGDFVPWWDKIN